MARQSRADLLKALEQTARDPQSAPVLVSHRAIRDAYATLRRQGLQLVSRSIDGRLYAWAEPLGAKPHTGPVPPLPRLRAKPLVRIIRDE